MTKPIFDITWDETKALSNLAKHGVTFAQAASVMLDPLALTVFDAGHSEIEERWFTLGISNGGRLLAVAHTHRIVDTANVKIRVISAREATRREQQIYENEPR